MADNQLSIWGWKKREVLFAAVVLLITIGISAYQLKTGEMKTRDAQRKADGRLIFEALTNYYLDYGQYPSANEAGQIIQCGYLGTQVCAWGEGPIVDVDNVAYLKKIPVDPLSGQGRTYIYQPQPDLKSARLFAALEYPQDPEIKDQLTKQCGTRVQCNWYVGN
jgi:hypothetical protein